MGVGVGHLNGPVLKQSCTSGHRTVLGRGSEPLPDQIGSAKLLKCNSANCELIVPAGEWRERDKVR